MPDTLEFPESQAYTATGDEIFEVIEALEPVLSSHPQAHIVMACLAIVLGVMNPNLTPEELSVGVKGASQWICDFLETTGSRISEAATTAGEAGN